ncbi:MAG: DUF3658 domain-containing protein [Desulfosporosinus sp.]|nr:DUF3658 domain-containing protein [Desulfosporosinus sp.]
MMKDITHICCSKTSMIAIKIALIGRMLEGRNVICLMDDLAYGSISDISDIDQRIKCLKKYPYDNEDFFIDLSNDDFLRSISTACGEEIYLWYGENATEMCNSMYILSLLESKIKNIYTINVSEMDEVGNKQKISVKHIVPEKLNALLPLKKPLNNEVYSSYMQLWLNLKKENSDLRVMKNRTVISVQEDYYDEMILQYTSNDFSHCARIVGEVVGKTRGDISFDFIFWRILELIKNNKITYDGNFGNIREMKIKRV